MFRLGPFGTTVPSARYYEPGTNVMITTWKTPQGWVEVRDGADDGADRRRGHRSPRTRGRPPTRTPTTCWCGRSRCLEGEVEIELVCEPAFDYGRTPAEWTLVDGSRHMADATGAGQTIRLQTDLELGIEVNRVRARHTLRPGERRYAALSWGDDLRGPVDGRRGAPRRLDATVRFWRRWLGRARPFADHRWREAIQRSALTIKGLTYMPTGATVAALTTSLPETPGGERNWDYRYTWMRDSTFTLQALHLLRARLGGGRVHAVRRRPRAQQRRRPADHVRDRRSARPDRDASARSSPGTPGAHPVRIGNGAFDQRQNDVFGAVLDSILKHTHAQPAPAASPVADRAGAGRSARPSVWRQPDQGIWEARGKPQHYVSSKLMCWVALDRAAKLAAIRGDRELAGDVAGHRRGDPRRHPRARAPSDGVLRQHYDTDALDASTLLAALFGFLPGDDERHARSRCSPSPTS